MASLTQRTWVWVNSGRCWRSWKPGVLQCMGSQSWTWLSDWTTTSFLAVTSWWAGMHSIPWDHVSVEAALGWIQSGSSWKTQVALRACFRTLLHHQCHLQSYWQKIDDSTYLSFSGQVWFFISEGFLASTQQLLFSWDTAFFRCNRFFKASLSLQRSRFSSLAAVWPQLSRIHSFYEHKCLQPLGSSGEEGTENGPPVQAMTICSKVTVQDQEQTGSNSWVCWRRSPFTKQVDSSRAVTLSAELESTCLKTLHFYWWW